jgi:hypothetical protein
MFNISKEGNPKTPSKMQGIVFILIGIIIFGLQIYKSPNDWTIIPIIKMIFGIFIIGYGVFLITKKVQ